MARSGRQRRKRPNPRAKYAPSPDQVGVRKYLPVSWVYWLGFVLFALVFIALFAETFTAIAEDRGTDPLAAGLMTCLFGFMVYMFATTRAKE